MCGVVVACAGGTQAQPIESITFSIEWEKPSIQFGETNTAKVFATITPDIGTQTKWNTSPGKGQAGVLKAFASSVMDWKSVQNGAKGSIALDPNPVFLPMGPIPIEPMPDGQGGFKGLPLGQVAFPLNPAPNTDQKVWLFDFHWTANLGPVPTSPYVVEYTTSALSAKVFLDIGTTSPVWVGENAVKIDGQGGFTVVPAPGIVVCGLFAIGVCVQRRRDS